MTVGLRCLRCGADCPLARYADDCDRCRPTAPSSLTVTHVSDRLAGLRREALRDRPPTLWRHAETLPVAAARAVTLQEGMTPPAERCATRTDSGPTEGPCRGGSPCGEMLEQMTAFPEAVLARRV